MKGPPRTNRAGLCLGFPGEASRLWCDPSGRDQKDPDPPYIVPIEQNKVTAHSRRCLCVRWRRYPRSHDSVVFGEHGACCNRSARPNCLAGITPLGPIKLSKLSLAGERARIDRGRRCHHVTGTALQSSGPSLPSRAPFSPQMRPGACASPLFRISLQKDECSI